MSSMATRVLGRRGFLTRLGGVVASASAATVLANQRKAFAVVPFSPQCCYGYPGCDTCPPSPQGGCCWYCTRCTANGGETFQCCDQPGDCICAYFVGTVPYC